MIQRWSYSSLTQYLRCPLQFFFQRVLCIPPQFTSSGLVLGSSVHESLAVYHRSLKDEMPIPVEAVTHAFIQSWRARKARERINFDGRLTENEILAQGVALLEAYLQEPPPQNVVAVEEEMTATIHTSTGEVLATPLTAIIELITRPDRELKITDLKTSSRSYSEMETDISLQATCYTHAVLENLGELPTFEFAVLVKTRKPKIQRRTTTRSEAHFGRLGDLVQQIERAVEADVFYPIESPLNCSSCPFRKPCRQWISDPGVPANDARSSPASENPARRITCPVNQPTPTSGGKIHV